MTRIIFIAALAALEGSVCAQDAVDPAQSGSGEIAKICSGALLPFGSLPFERFDRNSDERLTANEVQGCAALNTVFSRLDLDADQALTRAEYRGFADVWGRRRRAFGQDVD